MKIEMRDLEGEQKFIRTDILKYTTETIISMV